MELLTQNLPSGYDYPFVSIKIMPMNFAQILEYMENIPPSPVGKFYSDYKVVLKDDPNIDNLLLCDLEYVVFLKKCLTISPNLYFNTYTICHECGSRLKAHVDLSKIKFNPLSQKLLNGLTVELRGDDHDVSMPTVTQFMKIFSKYKMSRKTTDMNLIKLIALFEDAEAQLPMYDDMVKNAIHQDMVVIVALNDAYYKRVEPLYCECGECKRNFDRLKFLKMETIKAENELDAQARLKELEESKYGGITVGIDNLIVNLFREIIENNRPADNQIVPRKVRQNEQRGDVHNDVSR